MRIAIDINGVLRDTLGKFKQLYQKHMIDECQGEFTTQTYLMDSDGNTELESKPEPFEYQILSPITSLDLKQHFAFQNEEEYYSFMYEEFCMELFGHAPSTEMTSFVDLNEVYKDNKIRWDFSIISEQVGKSKPATLFFLSKFGCEIDRVFFFTNQTQNIIWSEFDVLLTANPNLLLNYPDKNKVIKFETDYNKDINTDYSISKIEELGNILKNLI
jgi:hypothetical protein